MGGDEQKVSGGDCPRGCGFWKKGTRATLVFTDVLTRKCDRRWLPPEAFLLAAMLAARGGTDDGPEVQTGQRKRHGRR